MARDRHGDNSPRDLHRQFARGVISGAPDLPVQIGTNPAVSERQARFFRAALGRKRKGESRPGDPKLPVKKLREFAKSARIGRKK